MGSLFPRAFLVPGSALAFRTGSPQTQCLLENALVAGPGIEPGTEAYETSEIPFLYPAIEVGGRSQIRTDGCRDLQSLALDPSAILPYS
jgi:hypothetical protein